MTFQQAAELGQLAKAKGLGIRAKDGRVQLVSVTYDARGKSTVTPHSEWLNYDEAKKALA